MICAMEDLPYFFKLLKEKRIIQIAIQERRLSRYDLEGFNYQIVKDNTVQIRNFELNEQLKFTTVSIFFSNYGILVDFVSRDSKYFEESSLYFNTRDKGRSKRPYIVRNKTYQVSSKRIVNTELFNKEVQGTILKSDLYGCKIMLSFF